MPYVENENEIFLKTIILSRKTTLQSLGEEMSNVKLDKEEKKLLKAYDKGEFESVLTPARKKRLQEAAAVTFKKDKRINIRISSHDLDAIQKRALVEGIPYQTLVSSILHKYISGSLRDITVNKPLQSDASLPPRR